MKCFRCSRELGKDDAGAYKRFVNRDADHFLCLACLCRDLGCTEEFLQKKIDFLREHGCLLFPKKDEKDATK